MSIEIIAYGLPAPKGSKRIGRHARRRTPIVIDDNSPAIAAWSDAVGWAAKLAVRCDGPVYRATALIAEMDFILMRPVGHWGASGLKRSAPVAPDVKPDIDKLVRCTLDPLKGIVFDEDSRVVQVYARKWYQTARDEQPGARVVVRPAGEAMRAWRL